MDQAVQVVVAGIAQGSIYALLGLGFSIVSMSTRILNLAQGSCALLGGFLSISLAVRFRLPLIVAFAASVAAAALFGAFTERFVNISAKPWKPVPQTTAVLATLALMVIVEGAASLIWGADTLRGRPLQPGAVQIAGAVVPRQYLWNIAAMLAITAALHCFLRFTWTGRAMRANRENSLMSHLLGVNVRRLGSVSFAIGGAVGATAGILASPITWIDYQMGGTFMLFGLLAFLIGGESRIAGAMVGGLLLGVVENLLLLVPGLAGGLLKQVVPMMALLLMLVFRPEGILGRKAP